MNLLQFVNRVVDEGIKAAKRDYARSDQREKLKGSIAGFEACRDNEPIDLKLLLDSAHQATETAREDGDEMFWWYRCYEAEVEFVCKCVSVVLMRDKYPKIAEPCSRSIALTEKILRTP